MGADAPIFMYFNRSNQFYNNSVAQSGTSSNKTIVRLFITIINLKKNWYNLFHSSLIEDYLHDTTTFAVFSER